MSGPTLGIDSWPEVSRVTGDPSGEWTPGSAKNRSGVPKTGPRVTFDPETGFPEEMVQKSPKNGEKVTFFAKNVNFLVKNVTFLRFLVVFSGFQGGDPCNPGKPLVSQRNERGKMALFSLFGGFGTVFSSFLTLFCQKSSKNVIFDTFLPKIVKKRDFCHFFSDFWSKSGVSGGFAIPRGNG